MDKSKENASFKGLTITILAIAALLGTVIVVFTVGPFSLRSKDFLTVGVLYDPNVDIEARFVKATNEAVSDLFNFANSHNPGVYLHFRNRTETPYDAFTRLKQKGVKVFIGLNNENEKDIIYDHPNETNEFMFLSTSTNTKSKSNLHSISPSSKRIALAYLHLINSTNPNPGSPLSVLPVMRDEPDVSELYSQIVLCMKQYPEILLMSPVIYATTEYPRSDAFQVISSIGSNLELEPDAEVLMLSSDDLPDILGMTHVNPTLKDRRWFAVRAARFEDEIKASSRGRRMASKISLTTLSFLGNGDRDVLQEELRKEYLSKALASEEAKGTVYEEWLAYEAMINLHKAYADSKTGSVADFSSSIRKVFGVTRRAVEEQKFASMFLMSEEVEEVHFVPKLKWLVEGIITASESFATYEEVATSPLTRNEIENIYQLKKPTCSNPTFSVDIIGNTFLPRTSMKYTLETFPRAVILPVAGGVGVTVNCAEDVFRFTCKQTETVSGELACIAITSIHPANKKQKRETVEDTENQNNTKALIEAASAGFDDIIGHWKELLPSAVGCFSSVAGCDFCYYFLATYNLSLSPASCNGGCSLSVVGSCTALLTDSISKTFG